MKYNYTADFVYETNRSIALYNSSFSCVTPQGKGCTIQFIIKNNQTNTTGFTGQAFQLTGGSSLTGRQVIIQAEAAQVLIDATSYINVSARSEEQYGTQANQGASYQGEGGSCGNSIVVKTYGRYNTYPVKANLQDFTQVMGSQGVSGNMRTNGGGRIVILGDSLKLTGVGEKLVAYGAPFKNDTAPSNTLLNGGTGGYIYVKVTHNFTQSAVDLGSKVIANGGFGLNGGMGGAGGVVILDKVTMASENVAAQAGQSLLTTGQVDKAQNNTCKHGAPGSVYYPQLEILSINKEGTISTKRFFLFGNTSNQLSFNTLELKNYTNLVLYNTATLFINQQFRTGYNTTITIGTAAPMFTMKFGMIVLLDPTTSFDFSMADQISIIASQPFTFASTNMTFKTSISITANCNLLTLYSIEIILGGLVQPLQKNNFAQSYIFLNSSTDITITDNPRNLINAARVTMIAKRNIIINGNTTIITSFTDWNNTNLSSQKPQLWQESPVKPDNTQYELFIGAQGDIQGKEVYLKAQKVGIIGKSVSLGKTTIRATQANNQYPPINIQSTSGDLTIRGRCNLIGNKVLIQGGSVSFNEGLSYDATVTVQSTKQESPLLKAGLQNPMSFQIAIVAVNSSVKLLGYTNNIKASNILIQAGTGDSIIQNGLLTATVAQTGANMYIYVGGSLTINNKTQLTGGRVHVQSLGAMDISDKSQVTGDMAPILGESLLQQQSDFNAEPYTLRILAGGTMTQSQVTYTGTSAAFIAGKSMKISQTRIVTSKETPKPNLVMRSGERVFLDGAYILGFTILLQSDMDWNNNNTQIISSVRRVRESYAEKGRLQQEFSSYNIIIKCGGYSQALTQIQTPTLWLNSQSNISIDGSIYASVTSNNFEAPPLSINALGQTIFTNADIQADQIIVSSQQGLQATNSNFTSSPYKQIASPLYPLGQQNFQNDIALMTYGVLTFNKVQIISDATFIQGGDTLMKNVSITANIVREQPNIVINTTSLKLTDYNYIVGGRLQIFAARSVNIDTNTFITVFQKEYTLGQKPALTDNQMYINAQGDLNIVGFQIKSYNTYLAGANVNLQNVKLNRFEETNTNQIKIEAAKNLKLDTYESQSSILVLQGLQKLEIRDVNLKVSSLSVTPPKVLTDDNNLQQVNSDSYTLRFISQGDVTFSGTNKYVADDLYLVGLNVNINFITLMISNYNKGPYINIYMAATNQLTFQEQSTISGGRIVLRGDYGVNFRAQTSILNNKQSGVNSDYTFQIISMRGPLDCKDCTFAGQTALIQTSEITGSKLKIDTDEGSMVPSVLLKTTGHMSIADQAMFKGVTIEVNAWQGYSFKNALFNSTQTVTNQKVGLLLRGKNGYSEVSTAQFYGQIVQIEAYQLVVSDIFINAAAATNERNLILFTNTSFESRKNFTANGGKMYLLCNEFIKASQDFRMKSIKTLIKSEQPLQSAHAVGQLSPDQFSIYIATRGSIFIELGRVQGPNIGIQAKDIQFTNTSIATDLDSKFQSDLEIMSDNNMNFGNQTFITGQNIKLTSKNLLSIRHNCQITSRMDSKDEDYSVQIHADQQIEIYDLLLQGIKGFTINSTNILMDKAIVRVNGLNNESYLRMNAERLLAVSGDTHIIANTMFFKGGTTLNLTNTKLSSTLEHTCNTDLNSNLFYCIKRSSLDKELSEDKFLSAFNIQYNKKFTELEDTYDLIEQSFTTYLVSYGTITLRDSTIAASRIGTCSSNLRLVKTTLNSDGRGCLSDTGLGKGQYIKGCAATGASHAGIGGYGSKSVVDDNEALCPAASPQPYTTKDTDAQFEGSGGGSSTELFTKGGDGGGIIWLSSANKMTLAESEVRAEGTEGVLIKKTPGDPLGSGGGSGGSIQFMASNFDGNSKVSVKGGAGSQGGGGGGSGGRIVMNFLGNYLHDFFDQKIYFWEGKLDLSGGSPGKQSDSQVAGGSGENGTEWHPSCLAGYSGPFCQPCPIGTYKYGYSHGKCATCVNKPKNAFYSEKAVSDSRCPYKCHSELDPVEVNPDCLNQIDLQIQRLGNSYYSLGLVGLLLVLTSVMLIRLIKKQADRKEQAANRKLEAFLEVGNYTKEKKDDDDEEEEEVKLELEDKVMQYHMHRLYLIGNNTRAHPWRLGKELPEGALKPEDQEKLEDNIEEFNFNWGCCSKFIIVVFKILYPLFALGFEGCFRRRHFSRLKKYLLHTFPQSFWLNTGRNKSLRVSASPADHTVAYLDFLDFSKPHNTPKLPQVIMIPGLGTYSNPYYFDYEHDPLPRSLIMLNKKDLSDVLPSYYENLNTKLRSISFNKFLGHTMKDLLNLIEYIEWGNRRIFRNADCKMTLYLFENTFKQDDNLKQKSFPLDYKLNEAFPETLKLLVQYLRLRIIQAKSEIRLGLVVTKLTSKNRKKEETLQMMIQQQHVDELGEPKKKNSTKKISFAVNSSDTMLISDYLSDDDLYTEDNTPASAGLNDSRLSTTSLMGHRGKRAYSLTKDSTKSLEESIQKPRNEYRHKCARFKAFWYSFFLVVLQYKTQPPRKGIFGLYLMLSFMIAADLVITMNFVFHLALPLKNIWTIGVPYFIVYPILPVLSPIFGILGAIAGNPGMLKHYIKINSFLCLFNYPLTIIVQLVFMDPFFYILEIVVLILLKMMIQIICSKVKADLESPLFHKNNIVLRKMIRKKADTGGDEESEDEDVDYSDEEIEDEVYLDSKTK